MHLFVSGIVSATTADCVDYDVSAHGAVVGIKVDGAPLKGEFAVNRVDYVTQGKIHRGLGRVKCQNGVAILAIGTRGEGEQEDRKGPEPILYGIFRIEGHALVYAFSQLLSQQTVRFAQFYGATCCELDFEPDL
jgi:hypothetical protein